MSQRADSLARDAIETARGEKRKSLEEEAAKPIHLHVADYLLEPFTTKVDIVFKQTGEETLEQFLEANIDMLESEERPMYVTYDVITNFFMEESEENLVNAVKALTEVAVASGRHRVTFSTGRFCADFERHWASLGDLNNEIRRVTQETGEQSLSLHKCFLTVQDGALATFAAAYAEFHSKKSLGRKPTEMAEQILLDWIQRHHIHAYQHPRRPKQKVLAPLPLPLPVSMTREYANDPFMVSVLKSRGMFHSRRARSTSRKAPLRRSSHRTISRERSESLVSGARPNGARSPNSLGLLERLLQRVSKGSNKGRQQDFVREREAERVTSRIAGMYQQKCTDLTRLSIDFESLKLEMDLLKESRDTEREAEISNLKLEVRKLREAASWEQSAYDKLFRVKDGLHHENLQLKEELEALRLSKKERRKAKKEKRKHK